ncbi:MAG: tetratricopeptide repeat protein [Alphaproteobacteria bacterium]|nr:tetratricopeptide repeat protein [Alphaproteobacteria bacterium]
MIVDHTGLQVSAASQEAAEAFDRTLVAYLRFGNDIGDLLKTTYSLDSEMVFANVLRGYFMHMMGVRALVPKAQQALEAAQRGAAAATAREQLHVKALEAWCELDLAGATAAWEECTREYPMDVLAVKMLHYSHFYMGDSINVRNSVGRVWHSWEGREDLPTYGYMLSMRAFGLEETGDYARAESLGRAAATLNEADAWAVHTVAHVCEMEDRQTDGIAWLDSKGGYGNWNNFRHHLAWHKALMLFEAGRHDDVLALYDDGIFDPKSDEYLDLTNDISVLARLDMEGIDVGDRWDILGEKAKGRVDDKLLAFVDAHFALALGATDGAAATDYVASIDDYSDAEDDTYAHVAQVVGHDLCAALVAYRARDFDDCIEVLESVRDHVNLIGGSNAQRDLFAQILIDASIRAERWELARSLLSERTALRPKNVRAWRHLSMVLKTMGDDTGAQLASIKADVAGMS